MEKANRITIEQARQIESLLSEYGINNVKDCDFTDLALLSYNYGDFFKTSCKIVKILTKELTNNPDYVSRLTISTYIRSLSIVSYILSMLVFVHHTLASVSELFCDVDKKLQGEKSPRL